MAKQRALRLAKEAADKEAAEKAAAKNQKPSRLVCSKIYVRPLRRCRAAQPLPKRRFPRKTTKHAKQMDSRAILCTLIGEDRQILI